MTGPVTLPTCSVRYPTCGACGTETDYDGDSYFCDLCDLDYGDGTESKPATYHLIDVEALAVGWVCAWDRTDGRPGITPPWRSDDLSTALGVPPPAKDTRHTALGDAAWALAIYDHITAGGEKAE